MSPPPRTPSPPAVTRKRHPARAARAVALVAGVGATAGLAGAMAHADRTPELVSSSDAVAPTEETTDEALGSAVTGEADPDTFAPSDPSEAGLADGTFTGSAEFTRWGDVQVEVTVSDGRIVDVAAVQAPSDGRSQSINAQAEPLLEEQAIAVQGAELDVVSGATATSEAYAASLQAAVDQATLEAGESVPG